MDGYLGSIAAVDGSEWVDGVPAGKGKRAFYLYRCQHLPPQRAAVHSYPRGHLQGVWADAFPVFCRGRAGGAFAGAEGAV